jgi:hypothetical protein
MANKSHRPGWQYFTRRGLAWAVFIKPKILALTLAMSFNILTAPTVNNMKNDEDSE